MTDWKQRKEDMKNAFENFVAVAPRGIYITRSAFLPKDLMDEIGINPIRIPIDELPEELFVRKDSGDLFPELAPMWKIQMFIDGDEHNGKVIEDAYHTACEYVKKTAGQLYTQVDWPDREGKDKRKFRDFMYLKGIHIVNRTGAYMVVYLEQ